jgi:hypothetical protein
MHAMRSRYEGIRAVAAEVLGCWGGDDSVTELKALLLATYSKTRSQALRGAVTKALSVCVRQQDAPWVLDLLFSVKGPTRKRELVWPLVASLPVEAARGRLIDELSSTDRWNRQAAVMAIAAIKGDFPDRRQLLERALIDPSTFVRISAHSFLQRMEDAE